MTAAAAERPLTDRVGIVLLGLWLVWVVGSSVAHGARFDDALPYLTAPTFLALGLWAGHRLQRSSIPDLFPPFLLLVSVYVLFSVTLMGGAGGGPLGYSNANAALGIQLTAVAGITALHTSGQRRTGCLWAAAFFALSVPWTLSQAGIALLLPFAGVLLLALRRPDKRRLWMLPLAAVAVLTAAVTVVQITRLTAWPEAFKIMFSGARRGLWSEAIALWSRNFYLGAGPGGFAATTSLATDSDTQRVHMSVLQVASELGLIGLALFGALILITYIKLLSAPPAPRLIATAALSALLIHSFVDHLLEFPGVLLATGTAIGLSTSYDSSPRPDQQRFAPSDG